MNGSPKSKPDSVLFVAAVFCAIALLAIAGTVLALSKGVLHVDLTFLVFFAVRGLLRGSARWRIFLAVVAWLYVVASVLNVWSGFTNGFTTAEIAGLAFTGDVLPIAIFHFGALAIWLSVALALHGNRMRSWCERSQMPSEAPATSATVTPPAAPGAAPVPPAAHH